MKYTRLLRSQFYDDIMLNADLDEQDMVQDEHPACGYRWIMAIGFPIAILPPLVLYNVRELLQWDDSKNLIQFTLGSWILPLIVLVIFEWWLFKSAK